MRNATSVKERLKNYAKKNNRIVQDIFTVYVLERTLYRISVTGYRDKFTLKGGILLYGLFTEDSELPISQELISAHCLCSVSALRWHFRY